MSYTVVRPTLSISRIDFERKIIPKFNLGEGCSFRNFTNTVLEGMLKEHLGLNDWFWRYQKFDHNTDNIIFVGPIDEEASFNATFVDDGVSLQVKEIADASGDMQVRKLQSGSEGQ